MSRGRPIGLSLATVSDNGKVPDAIGGDDAGRHQQRTDDRCCTTSRGGTRPAGFPGVATAGVMGALAGFSLGIRRFLQSRSSPAFHPQQSFFETDTAGGSETSESSATADNSVAGHHERKSV